MKLTHAVQRPRAGSAVLLAVTALLALATAGCETSPGPPVGPTFLVSSVVISPVADTVSIGGTAQFSAAVYDTADMPTGTNPGWKSTNTAIFTVTSFGRVTGVGEGTALLIAQAGGQADTASVTVLPGGGWFLQNSGTTANLHGVFFVGASGWAVGDGGTIVRTTNSGTTWTRGTVPTTFSLNGVWFTSPSEGWAVGVSGTVLRSTDGGVTWTRLTNVQQGEALTDVHFATRDTGWVVGAAGLVLRTFDAGASWQTFRLPTAAVLNSVSFYGTKDGWTVGNTGVIGGTHDRGLTWFIVQPAITSQTLHAVSRPTLAAAFAVGAQGVAPRTVVTPDSVVWEVLNAGIGRQLEGGHYPTPTTGYAVGYDASLGGSVLRTDDAGLSWEAQVSNTSFRLDDVYFTSVTTGWAVGDAGTIIHTARGGRP